ncbi:cysteinyl-tRNA synthetase [candidate division TM7 genomosp. GTL1]|nr:cysteinyl-tRNA synthetase [candidate division TM7 genomosp. GTL1]
MLTLYNTPHRKLEEFTPVEPGKVSVYTCGPTVYDYLTVGNWIAYIRWDTLVRTLRANGLAVTHAMNITDVGHLTSDEDHGEDKMQKGARREGKTAWDIAAFYTNDFLEGMKQLNLLTPEHIPKATEYIPQQLELVRALKQKGFTYQIDDGIYFDTSKFPRYAQFAHLDLDALKAGARVEHNAKKRSPSDFALWKFTQPGEIRDMEWDTPIDLLDEGEPRKGFPGWHLECSAMAMDIFGPTLDIHAGGIDHIPVHHTNEIAQSEAATDKLFARYWIHCNHIKADGTKISKSLGNGYTLQDLATRDFSPLDYRTFALQSHYRTEGNFTWENLEGAKNRRAHWREIAALRWQTYDTLVDDSEKTTDERTVQLINARQEILLALNDDLNTPLALQIIDEVFSELEKHRPVDIQQSALEDLLTFIDDVLGIKLLDSTPDISDEAKQLILERQQAREAKDFKKSDELRDTLLKHNIGLRDTQSGTLWFYA